jgi:hypothetical protein
MCTSIHSTARDEKTTMDPDWEGECLIGKTIQAPLPYGKVKVTGVDVFGSVTADSNIIATCERVDDPHYLSRCSLEEDDRDPESEVVVGTIDSTGVAYYYGKSVDPEHPGADLVGRRVALCTYNQDQDGDGEIDEQSDPKSWLKRPFCLEYDASDHMHKFRFADGTEERIALEPHGNASWRYLKGW